MLTDWFEYRKVITNLGEKAIDRLIPWGERTYKKRLAEQKNKDPKTFQDYLSNKSASLAYVRSLIHYSQRVLIDEIYVVPDLDMDLTLDEKSRNGNTLIRSHLSKRTNPKLRPTRATAIVGMAGMGKSLFLKHAFFQMKSQTSRIPIFIELRALNRIEPSDFERIILDEFAQNGNPIMKEQASLGLKTEPL